jgi:hypothetical protein
MAERYPEIVARPEYYDDLFDNDEVSVYLHDHITEARAEAVYCSLVEAGRGEVAITVWPPRAKAPWSSWTSARERPHSAASTMQWRRRPASISSGNDATTGVGRPTSTLMPTRSAGGHVRHVTRPSLQSRVVSPES